MHPMLRKDILIMIGVLAAAWFVKVVGVFLYLTFSKRRAAELEAERAAGAADAAGPVLTPPPKVQPTPPHIIAALPVMAYSSLRSSSSSCSCCKPAACVTCSRTLDAPTALGHELQRDTQQVVDQAAPPASEQTALQQPQRFSADLRRQGQDQNPQQPRQRARFALRLSFDSALLRKQQQVAAAAATAASPAAAPTGDAAAAASEASEADTCAICFCDYEANTLVKLLPCGHFYHSDCIDVWLNKGNTCPLCKRPVWTEAAGDAAVVGEQVQQELPGPGEQGQQGSQGVVIVVHDDTTRGGSTPAVSVPEAATAGATDGAAAAAVAATRAVAGVGGGGGVNGVGSHVIIVQSDSRG